MIRDRLKAAARKAALRAFGMEWQAEAKDPASQRLERPPERLDMAVIPRVVDGSGDTPGPNHKEDIGRTWLAAQVVSSAAPMLIDLRHPKECAGGTLPGAVVMPGDQVRQRLTELPPQELRVVLYDQIGGEEAAALASWLREQGWSMARRLAGGYAEWIEHAEPVAAPAGKRFLVGTMVRYEGRDAWVQGATTVDGRPAVLLYAGGPVIGPVPEDQLGG